MFAIAIWDEPNPRLVLARDHLEQKPLFYSEPGGTFRFASELNSLFEDPALDRELNFNALIDFLTGSYTPTPSSIFRKIRKPPPSHRLVWEKGRSRIERYSGPSDEEQMGGGEGGIRRRHVQAAGGVHEASPSQRRATWRVVEWGNRFQRGRRDNGRTHGQPVKTYSIGFEVANFNELEFARAIAEKYGTDHEECIVRPNVVEILPRPVWHFGEPFGNPSALPTFYLSEMTCWRDGSEGELREYTREILLDPTSLRRGYFQVEALTGLLNDHVEERKDHGFLIWSLLVLELWHRTVLEGRGKPNSVSVAV